MAGEIHIDISGTRQVGLRFDQFPDALRDELRATIDDLANQLFAMVQARTPNRTGQLLGQEGVKVFVDADKISGKVFVLAPDQQSARKAAALEYGSTGQAVTVKGHAMSLDHYWSTKLAAPQTVIVAAYSRTPNIAETAFERGPLEEMAPEIAVRLNATVEAATKAANA